MHGSNELRKLVSAAACSDFGSIDVISEFGKDADAKHNHRETDEKENQPALGRVAMSGCTHQRNS